MGSTSAPLHRGGADHQGSAGSQANLQCRPLDPPGWGTRIGSSEQGGRRLRTRVSASPSGRGPGGRDHAAPMRLAAREGDPLVPPRRTPSPRGPFPARGGGCTRLTGEGRTQSLPWTFCYQWRTDYRGLEGSLCRGEVPLFGSNMARGDHLGGCGGTRPSTPTSPVAELGGRLAPAFKPGNPTALHGVGGVLLNFGRGGERILDACHASEERGTLAARHG
jgi:hypothetical protein